MRQHTSSQLAISHSQKPCCLVWTTPTATAVVTASARRPHRTRTRLGEVFLTINLCALGRRLGGGEACASRTQPHNTQHAHRPHRPHLYTAPPALHTQPNPPPRLPHGFSIDLSSDGRRFVLVFSTPWVGSFYGTRVPVFYGKHAIMRI